MNPRKREARTQRRLRRIAVLPSLVTLLNAICGFAAIHFTARGMNEPDKLLFERPELTFFAAAAWMVFLAMIADAVDGWLARMARSASSFGGQLDSLADGISFGVAPAFLMLRVMENSIVGPASPVFGSILGRLLWLLAATYVCCAVLRLARFNVETGPDESAHLSFQGLPSPAAAGVVASLVLLYSDLFPELQSGPAQPVAHIGSQIIIYILPFVTLAVALLMVSRIPYSHVINQYIRQRRPFGYMVRVVFWVLLLAWKLQLTLAITFAVYAASGTCRWLWLKYVKKSLVYSEKPAQAGENQETLPTA